MTAPLSFITEMVLQYPTFSIGSHIVTIIQSHNNPNQELHDHGVSKFASFLYSIMKLVYMWVA